MGKIANTIRSWTVPIEQRKQLLAFDRELEEAERDRDGLRKEKLKLQSQVSPLQAEVARLKVEVEQLKQRLARSAVAPTGEDDVQLDEAEERIIGFLAHSPQRLQARACANLLGISQIRTEVVLDRLEVLGLIHKAISISQPPDYALTHEGKAFAVKRNYA